MITTIDWVQEAELYADFLNLDPEDNFHGNTQEQARQWCKEMLEHMIAINGTGDLYETERQLAKDLGMDLDEL